MPDTSDPAAEPDLRTLVEIERRTGQRTLSETVSDALLTRIGTLACLATHAVGLVLWCLINLGAVPYVRPFDPFPFGVLTLIVSAEGVFLCLVILISQNRMTRQADHRARLTLQISLLAERESTKMLQMVQRLCASLGLDSRTIDDETRKLSQPTDVAHLAERLEASLKED
jgi:uncharacterized membrane protein